MKISLWILSIAAMVAGCSTGRIALKETDRIVFFGDSITEMGMGPKGYITLIKDSLARLYPSIQVIGAGISGNKVTDLQQRVDRDVIAKKPTLVFIYIGINDVWHAILPGHTGTSRDAYENGLKEVIGKIKAANAHVVLCTPTVIGERWDRTNQLDLQLDEYAAISRRVAQATGSTLCDLRLAFIKYLATHNPVNKESGVLTTDTVHMNDDGNRLIATEMLKSLE